MTTDPKQRIQLTNPVHCLATGFGSGLLPKIPGTFGTLAAVPFYLLLMQWSVWALIIAVMIGGVVGIYLCDQTAKDMGVHDHGSIVWDEFIGFWLTMIFFTQFGMAADTGRLCIISFFRHGETLADPLARSTSSRRSWHYA